MLSFPLEEGSEVILENFFGRQAPRVDDLFQQNLVSDTGAFGDSFRLGQVLVVNRPGYTPAESQST